MMYSPNGKSRQVARLLAHVTGLMNQELLLRNEYLTVPKGGGQGGGVDIYLQMCTMIRRPQDSIGNYAAAVQLDESVSCCRRGTSPGRGRPVR